ncbi:hypothetical protein ENBRE01_2152 [Enteropsectra breve]|nr:hypothetical protein ENBRE01_2152 [Enteropsectra breve]
MAINQWIDDDCGITLKALKNKCLSEFDITVRLSTINRCIAKFFTPLNEFIIYQKGAIHQMLLKKESIMQRSS